MPSESEFILNPDGTIYHLHLRPEDVAHTIITVGDPDRVESVSKHFDTIEVRQKNREFLTHTGHLNQKKLTVISTGIGTDNIDIVLNELDALVNIDFATGETKNDKTVLNLIRIGTSGAIQPNIELDTFLASKHAIGLDGLLHFYHSENIQNLQINNAFSSHLKANSIPMAPYTVDGNELLLKSFNSNRIRFGVTVTNAGFYGPQGRRMRLSPRFSDFNTCLSSFGLGTLKITNLEMETAGIYGLAKLLGHRAISLNAILANRVTGKFSQEPQKTVERLIQYTLDKISSMP